MPHQILIEKEMIEKCRSGSLHDFRKLVETISPFAFSVAFRMVGDEELAKDIVQETMITVWKTIRNIKSPGSFMSWLYRIVVNKCYDQLRRRKVNPEFRADDKTWALISDKISEKSFSQLENSETIQIINLLTEKLSPKQKAVFILCDLEELSSEEISVITGMSRTSIKSNLHYARKRIGGLIERHI
jgi:RNA polymerase sigma-70 factor (ECF subfamily)